MTETASGLNAAPTFGTPGDYSMDAIVVNTLTGAVSEYQNFAFHSIIPGYAGAANGLYVLGGDTDNGEPIIGTVMTGKSQFGDSIKKRLGSVFFALKGSGDGEMLVVGESGSYVYTLDLRASGESRGQPGKGIRENYLSFGYRNADGSNFELDRIEVTVVAAKYRRI